MPFPAGIRTPDARVEIAFDSGFSTPAVDRTWTDVSAWLEGTEGISITYGRADEQATVSPSTCSLTLDNLDGRFTPGNASSPYYPNVKKGRPLRVSVTRDGVEYVRFTGYLDEIPVEWPDSTDAVSTVTLTASSRRARLGQSAALQLGPLTQELFADDPRAYWPLDDAADGDTFRQQREVIGGGNSVMFSHWDSAGLMPISGDRVGPIDEGGMVKVPLAGYAASYLSAATSGYFGGTDTTFEFTFRIKPDDDLAGCNATAWLQTFGVDNAAVKLSITCIYTPFVGWNMSMDTFLTIGPNGVTEAESIPDFTHVFPDVADGLHHAAVTIDSSGHLVESFMDGVSLGTQAMSGSLSPLRSVFLSPDGSGGAVNGDVWFGHVTLFDAILSADRIAAHAAAALDFPDETTADRVVRVAALGGIPAAEVNATDDSPILPQKQWTRAVAEILDETAASTGTVLYDEREGNLALPDKDARFNIAAAFTASAANGEIQSGLAPVLDDQGQINDIAVSTGVGGEQVASATYSDQGSIDEYGLYHADRASFLREPGSAESLASWLVGRYAEPSVRLKQVGFDLTNLDAALVASLLVADIGTKFTIEDLPAQAPAPEMDLFVEGYSEQIDAVSHSITFNTSPGDLDGVWFLGDAVFGVLDSTTRLAY